MTNTASKKTGLGRGLRALVSTQAIPQGATTATPDPMVAPTSPESSIENTDSDAVRFLKPSQLLPNPEQPRKEFEPQELQELADSIKAMGLLQPILVRPGSDNPAEYEIIAGERRWRASCLAELETVPVIIKDFSDQETLEAALVENIQRSDLSPVEEARAYQLIMEKGNLSQQTLSEKVGKDRASISNYIRLLKLPEEILSLVENGRLSMGHAKAILTVKEPSAQKNLAKKVIEEKLSVRALEDIVSRVVTLKNDKKKKKSVAKTAFPEVVDRLRESLGTKVSINHNEKQGKGKIEIQYFSEDELDRLVEKLGE